MFARKGVSWSVSQSLRSPLQAGALPGSTLLHVNSWSWWNGKYGANRSMKSFALRQEIDQLIASEAVTTGRRHPLPSFGGRKLDRPPPDSSSPATSSYASICPSRAAVYSFCGPLRWSRRFRYYVHQPCQWYRPSRASGRFQRLYSGNLRPDQPSLSFRARLRDLGCSDSRCGT